jgi:hypothetical protein
VIPEKEVPVVLKLLMLEEPSLALLMAITSLLFARIPRSTNDVFLVTISRRRRAGLFRDVDVHTIVMMFPVYGGKVCTVSILNDIA